MCRSDLVPKEALGEVTVLDLRGRSPAGASRTVPLGRKYRLTSTWRRGTNENPDGLLRQGTRLVRHTFADLDAIAANRLFVPAVG